MTLTEQKRIAMERIDCGKTRLVNMKMLYALQRLGLVCWSFNLGWHITDLGRAALEGGGK